MPAGNQSSTNSDYRVGDGPPPPEATAIKEIELGTAFSFVGSVTMLVAGLAFEGEALLWLGFVVSMAGVALSLRGLHRLKQLGLREGTPSRVAFALVLGESKHAGLACPMPAADSRYRLDAKEDSECPPSWPAGTWVYFYRRDTMEELARRYLVSPATTVTLQDSPLLLSPTGEPFRIDVA